MICLKIRTFVVATTTHGRVYGNSTGCDLLENTYLCGSNNNAQAYLKMRNLVVICLKIRTFVVATTTRAAEVRELTRCDLLENTYLCGSNNNRNSSSSSRGTVVICLKIRTFVVATTTHKHI